MGNELIGFFTMIMKDLDDREKMCRDCMLRKPDTAEKTQAVLINIGHIKRLTLNRARQFGLVVNDDQEMIKEEKQVGVADMEAYTQRLKKLDPRILIHLGEY